ncbi:MAG: GntR family transcriptional regulator [Treponema sp.]|jgi:DNA-binding GntR family transcriptional regulator|nr:GntR family transcriptional regulator [Treponema sp.]
MTQNISVLTDYAYSEILQMILSAVIQPGTRIREDLLAAQLGISRTPVREAVNRLTQTGFITNINRKGLYCVKVTTEDLLNLLDLRITLETLSFEKCIDLASEDDIRGLQQIIDTFRENMGNIQKLEKEAQGKAIAFLHNDYDVRFHVGIAKVSKSIRLIKYVQEVETMLLLARRRIYVSAESLEIVALSWLQHGQMLDAIRLRDKNKSKYLLEEHLKLMRETQVTIEDEPEDETQPNMNQIALERSCG